MRVMNTPAVQVQNLSLSFGSFTAVNGLSLTVEQGSIHGFLGPNGAGKSTTIRALIGVLKPQTGSVAILGQDPVAHPDVLRRVGYVPGDATLWDNLTGAEVFRALESLRKTPSNRALENELIDAFQLDPSKKIREYSTGNRRKVSLIAALSHEPELLIVDEPTAGLDPIMEQVFVTYVRKARTNGASVLLSSHILSEVEQLCDYVTVLKEGRAVASNEVSYLRKISAHRITATIPAVPQHLAGRGEVDFDAGHLSITCDASEVPDILRIIIDAGGQDIISTAASLEEIFLRHYGETVSGSESKASQ
ncbi:ABC transporter ATPase [[Brevibacterium] flavum]|nr:ABC transporter ATPase [[Brevibacterium] flavum]ANE09680.1 multidrug ABC transporter ATP-binding protein [Corynebacterium glutamicum]KIH72340.1 ABC transporter ATPase [Corynebacterium glutamicum]OKX95771.1 multidrug ABC transporter ATP-binding protein [Corynebacterium glutamicum]CAF18978.1 ABC-type multidrug transport system, ATPase component [Corynebacterium glutamicum ATCC 13032]